MDLFIYRNNGVKLEYFGMCSDAISVLWIRRFFRGDSFTIEVPATPKNLEMFQKYHIVAYGDNAGYITAYDIDVKGKIIAKGTSFDGMLTRRILVNYRSGDSLLTVISRNAVELAEENRKFTATVTDYSVDADGMLSEATRYQQLSEYVRVIGESQNFGVFGRFNHSTNLIELYGRYSVDRSKNQTVVKPVIFSDTFGNAADITYSYNSAPEINAIYFYGKGSRNYEQHKDIYDFEEWFYQEPQKSGYQVTERNQQAEMITTTEYRQSGGEPVEWEVLDYNATYYAAKSRATEMYSVAVDNVACRIVLHGDYRNICDVGDIVTVYSQKYNVTANKMITEIREFTDSTKQTIEATIGDPPKTFADAVKNVR